MQEMELGSRNNFLRRCLLGEGVARAYLELMEPGGDVGSQYPA